MAVEERLPGEYIFKFQFFVHECALSKDFFNIHKPAIAIRFLDFPTLILEGVLQENGKLKFGQGKKCNFKMHTEELRNALINKPFFVMFIDASNNNIQMIASSNVNVGVLAKNYEFFDDEKANWNIRRNFLFLFDNMKNEVMKLDVSIGVSLLEKREQEKLQSKLQQIHPVIPNAKLGSVDNGHMHIQNYARDQQQIAQTQQRQNQNIMVLDQRQAENDDPNLIIAQNKVKLEPQMQRQIASTQQQSKGQQQQKTLNQPQKQLAQNASQSSHFEEEILSSQESVDRVENDKQVQRIEQEHRMAINKQKKDSSLQKLLDQPYAPPPMFYEKKQVLPPEKAVIMKQSAQGKVKGPQLQIMKEALNTQQQRFQNELEVKQKIINQQKEILVKQDLFIKEAQQNVKIQDDRNKDKDFIQLNDLQKLQELEPKDKYNVLEFLIKELISLKQLSPEKPEKKKKHRKRSSSEESDSESSSDDDSSSSEKRKKKKKKDKKKQKKGNKKNDDSTIEVKSKHHEKEGDIESISVDDNDQIVKSSRKDWEEELTSTQNLGVPIAVHKNSSITLKPTKFNSYQPTKLNNFMMATPDPHNQGIESIRSENRSENDDDYEDDDFESISKSQIGLSISRVASKNKGTAHLNTESDGYDQEKFESMQDSKSLSNEGTVTCFLCRQQIPKSQSKTHVNVCKKMSKSSGRNNTEESGKNKKYSPIRETEDEAHNSNEGGSSGDNYSSQQFDESSARNTSTKKGAQSLLKKSADQLMRESYMSSSMSTEKPIHSAYAKQVADFLKTSAEKDELSGSQSESNEKSGGGELGGVLDQFNKYKALIAKYTSGEYDESSQTISKSQ